MSSWPTRANSGSSIRTRVSPTGWTPKYLARVGRLDPSLLAPLRHRSAGTQKDLAVLRSRMCLVRARTRLISHVRGAVKSFGGRLPGCGADAFATKAEGGIPPELTAGSCPGPCEHRPSQRGDQDSGRPDREDGPRELPGDQPAHPSPRVGTLTAQCFLLTIEDPARFPKTRAVGSYVGLRPRQADSGSLSPQLRITKAGDDHLRWLLVTAAHYILGPFGPDSDLRRWGLALCEKGGKSGKKRAVVAVARKLAVLLLRLWQTGEIYEPLRNTNRRAVAHACA